MTIKEYEQFEQEQNERTQKLIQAMLALLLAFRKDVDRELSDFYRKYGSDGVVTYQEANKYMSSTNHRRRMIVLFMAITTALTSMFNDLHLRMDSHFRDIVKREFKLHGLKVSDELLEKILKTKWVNEYGSSNWEERLDGYHARWGLVLPNDVKTAFHTNNDIDDIMDDYNIRQRSMQNLLTTLINTEATAVGSIARREIFRQQGIKKYKHYERMDERTCDECVALHGKVFPISAYEVGVTASPLHLRCRGWEMPVN